MNLYPLPIVVLFLGVLIKFRAPISNPTHLTGDVSINCGSRGNSAANSGREWIGDIQPKCSSLLQMKGSSTTSTVIPQLLTADPVPHETARISQSQFSYAFQVSAGQKIIRLHFNPTSYKGFEGFKDLFTVEAGPFTLFGNFSASLTADALGVDYFVKEFCLNIQENQQLNIFFSPEGSQSLDTYAFINGIEIFSVPASLSYFQGGDVGLQLVGEKSPVYIDSSTALEIIHQVEIEQSHVKSIGDFDGMFLKWVNRNAKKRNNFTWKMPVDVGFKYLIRVHFSELGLKIAGTDDNMFKVLINEMIARTNVDVVKERDENNIPWHRDYTVMMRGNKKEGKRDILISLQSYDELIDDRALLTGFEIFKLSNNDNSLASPNPLPLARDPPLHTVETLFLYLCHRNGIANVAIAIISLVCVTVHKLREIHEANITEEGNKSKRKPLPLPSVRAERLCRPFSLNEVQLATKNFSDALLIGGGGFGRVYKGVIDEGNYTFAVKRSKSSSEQGAHQFLTEIETLSELRHANLVSLIGYCNEQGEMILVYEYMPCGTLADHIYKLARENNTCSSLTWKQRLDICIGAGRGLDYLHTGHGVIHRDVKATNILLNENFIAKVSDFGLAKLESRSKLQSHVSTNVKGTFGYLDPNYYNTCKLTRKSDTYAFGVVLLEVLCGRPAVDSMVAEDEKVLLMWARDKINMGEVDQIVSTSLREEISPNSLKTFVGVALRCLSAEGKKRPTMSQVVSQLELAAEQQETEQPMEIAATSVSDDSHCPNNDKDGLSVQTGQPTIFSTAVQNSTHPPIEQTNNPCPNNDKDGLSVQKGQPAIFSTAVQNFRPPPKEQTNSEVVTAQLPFKENELSSLPAELDLSTSAPAINESFSTARTMRSPADLCRQFSFEEIKAATGNFDENSIVGRGEYFKVYKGLVKDGTTTVAMKRLNVQLDRGAYMFLANIKMMLEIRHLHLVSLIGYCDDFNEMILVYDYMAHGSLHNHLYNSENPQLTWKTRLQICIGAAIGLNYLRTGTEYPIMHRKVNSTNILLDEKWVAKVSAGPIAGQYLVLLQARIKNGYDVYDLGMVLLEVLFAKPAEQADSDIWAEVCKRERILERYIDSNLYGQIAPECLSIFVETALACIKISESERPAMSDVIRSLEFAMQLQESVEHRSADDGGDNFP